MRCSVVMLSKKKKEEEKEKEKEEGGCYGIDGEDEE